MTHSIDLTWKWEWLENENERIELWNFGSKLKLNLTGTPLKRKHAMFSAIPKHSVWSCYHIKGSWFQERGKKVRQIDYKMCKNDFIKSSKNCKVENKTSNRSQKKVISTRKSTRSTVDSRPRYSFVKILNAFSASFTF